MEGMEEVEDWANLIGNAMVPIVPMAFIVMSRTDVDSEGARAALLPETQGLEVMEVTVVGAEMGPAEPVEPVVRPIPYINTGPRRISTWKRNLSFLDTVPLVPADSGAVVGAESHLQA